MKTYHIAPSPALVISGWLTQPGFLHDEPKSTEENPGELAQHFNDVYMLFMHKVSTLAYERTLSKKEEVKLRSLFSELLETHSRLK